MKVLLLVDSGTNSEKERRPWSLTEVWAGLDMNLSFLSIPARQLQSPADFFTLALWISGDFVAFLSNRMS